MKEQTHGNGFALSEMLYGQRKTSNKVANPFLKNNKLDRIERTIISGHTTWHKVRQALEGRRV